VEELLISESQVDP